MSTTLSLQLHTDRYFTNPFIGSSESVQQLVTKEWLLKNLNALSNRIIGHSIPPDGRLKNNPYVGPPGIAYALFRAMKAAETQKQPLNFGTQIRTLLAKSESDAHKCRYLTGTLGLRTVQGVVKELSIDKLTSHFRGLLPSVLKIDEDEMMNGRAGFLTAALEIRSQLGCQVLKEDEIRTVLQTMINSGRHYAKRHKSLPRLMYQWHDSEYFGAAHGISGIYQTMLSYWNLLDEQARVDLKQSVDWFLGIQLSDGNFPSSSDRIGERAKLVHWCHGAPGVLQMLISAHLVFSKGLSDGEDTNKYLKGAERCANVIWEKGLLRKGPGLCHGVAGNGYAFLLLYRLTHNEDYLNKAKAFAFIMMSSSFENQARTPDSPLSLFEGWSGALCFLADLLNPASVQFPCIPLCFDK